MKLKLVNLTPHDVVVHLENGEKKVYPSVGSARVTTTSEVVGQVDGIDIVTQSYGDIEGLPKPKEGVLYIVSLVVRMAAQQQGRDDVISPDTSPQGAIRDDAGRIIAVRRFVR